jgi:hypothetical protein
MAESHGQRVKVDVAVEGPLDPTALRFTGFTERWLPDAFVASVAMPASYLNRAFSRRDPGVRGGATPSRCSRLLPRRPDRSDIARTARHGVTAYWPRERIGKALARRIAG